MTLGALALVTSKKTLISQMNAQSPLELLPCGLEEQVGGRELEPKLSLVFMRAISQILNRNKLLNIKPLSLTANLLLLFK